MRVLCELSVWSSAEIKRMDQFTSLEACTSWCLSRILARSVLSFFSCVQPDELCFSFEENGKPYLQGSNINFNWSHTSGCIGLAVTSGRRVGIDVENINRSMEDFAEIARLYFLKEEFEWISSALYPDSWLRFLSLFVQKEAYLKATGEGLSSSLAMAPAFKVLPFQQSPGHIIFRTGKTGHFMVTARMLPGLNETPLTRSIVNEGSGFDLYREWFDPVSGLMPVLRWKEQSFFR